jgi:hypothetical protein
MAIVSTSPVSPGLAIDHSPVVRWSPPYSRRISELCAKLRRFATEHSLLLAPIGILYYR